MHATRLPLPRRSATDPLTPEQRNAAAQKAKRSKMKEAGYLWRGYRVDQGSIDGLAELKKKATTLI